MKYRNGLTKIDVLVVLLCVVFLLLNLGALGRSGRGQAKKAVCISTCRQWALAIKNYTDDNDDYYPARYWPDMHPGAHYTVWSWPHMYFKLVDTDLITTFIEPYLGEQKYTMCPSYPAESTTHLPYQEQKEKNRVNREFVLGDIGMFVGYPPKDGSGSRGCVCNWPVFEPPQKAQLAPSSMAVAGDMVREADRNAPDGQWNYSHPYANGVGEEPKGMCASFADMSARWVDFEDMATHSEIEQLSYRYYWPDPRK